MILIRQIGLTVLVPGSNNSNGTFRENNFWKIFFNILLNDRICTFLLVKKFKLIIFQRNIYRYTNSFQLKEKRRSSRWNRQLKSIYWRTGGIGNFRKKFQKSQLRRILVQNVHSNAHLYIKIKSFYFPNKIIHYLFTIFKYHWDLKKQADLRKCSILIAVALLWHVALVRHQTTPSLLF